MPRSLTLNQTCSFLCVEMKGQMRLRRFENGHDADKRYVGYINNNHYNNKHWIPWAHFTHLES